MAHLVTGYKGAAHITPADDGAFNAALIGTGDYVLPIGERFKAQIITNNSIRIFDGNLLMQGRHVNIPAGTYEDVTIANGAQDTSRNDLIVMRYTKDGATGIETAELAVVQGTATSGIAEDPAVITGDILAGAEVHEMPLYRVSIVGLTAESIAPLFTVIANLNAKPSTLADLGITASDTELNYMDGVTSGVQGQLDANESRADRFFPDSAMHNLVTDCLQINTVEDWTSNSGNRDSVIATEDVSTIANSPISSGAFYAYREIRQVECAGRNPKTIVTLKEAYPIGGREWSRAYNPDTGSWDEQWNCHDSACSHRDLGKSITDIVTNEIVYVCTPDRSKTMPICASEFTTGDGHNLTNKADKNHGHSTLGEIKLGDGTDLNTVTAIGVYRISTAVNAPSDGDYGYSQLFVGHGGGDTIFQMIVGFGSAKVFVRAGNPSDVGGNGSWTAWKTLIDMSKIANNLATTAEGYVLDARQGKVLLDYLQSFPASHITPTTTGENSDNCITTVYQNYLIKNMYLVQFSFYFNSANVFNNGAYVGNVPEGYRPRVEVVGTNCRVQTDGNVYYTGGGINTGGGANVWLGCMWMAV